jgi:hypothetical protein
MSEPTPLTPESVDALLSAELDGDFDAAAHDLGLDASAARVQLDATPGVGARRTALTNARDLIASRPEVEASAHERMIAAALATDDLRAVRDLRRRRDRQWRVLLAAGSVAAAIAVIVGIASMGTTTNSNAKASSARATTTVGPKAANAETGGDTTKSPTTPVDFGDVTKSLSLRNSARHLLARAATNDQVATSTQVPLSIAPSPGTQSTSGNAFDKSFAAADAPACTAARLRSFNVPAQPALIASGTVKGAPVVILIYDGSGSPYAYVIRVSDCALLRKQPLG